MHSLSSKICLLANSERPNFLKLDYLHKTFALELIESVLTNYHELFRKHAELLMLLQHDLCPLILKSLSDRHVFPLTLRCTRVVSLILKQFSFTRAASRTSQVWIPHVLIRPQQILRMCQTTLGTRTTSKGSTSTSEQLPLGSWFRGSDFRFGLLIFCS
ncbi:hypothetical protein EV424DRAFT_548446 [Suillus variegatus]|nr:hypothetical protein EV424DRAFT_548446 [Suillus variegatus]